MKAYTDQNVIELYTNWALFVANQNVFIDIKVLLNENSQSVTKGVLKYYAKSVKVSSLGHVI